MKQVRNTAQRVKILEYLKSVKTHPTAEMVFQKIKSDMPMISLATVYRNLNYLSENGDILKMDINGEFRFDGDTCNHIHCVCRKCSKIIDVVQNEITDFAKKKVESQGFNPDCVFIMFKGLCKDCR